MLLTALARDGFASLANSLEAAETETARSNLKQRFLAATHAYRAWSLEHPSEYALMFGTPVPGFEVYGPEVKSELTRGVNVLFRIMIEGVQSGVLHPPPLEDPELPDFASSSATGEAMRVRTSRRQRWRRVCSPGTSCTGPSPSSCSGTCPSRFSRPTTFSIITCAKCSSRSGARSRRNPRVRAAAPNRETVS